MNYTKPKEQLISEVYSRVYGVASSNMYNLQGQPLGNAISSAIAAGIQEAVRTLLENTYTDQQFEEDIGFKK